MIWYVGLAYTVFAFTMFTLAFLWLAYIGFQHVWGLIKADRIVSEYLGNGLGTMARGKDVKFDVLWPTKETMHQNELSEEEKIKYGLQEK